MAGEALTIEVSGRWVWSRPRLAWMNGVTVTLDSEGMAVEAA